MSEQVIAINRLSRITLWIVASLAILSAVGWWLSTRAPSTWLDPNTLAADPESDRRGRELEQNLASAIARAHDASIAIKKNVFANILLGILDLVFFKARLTSTILI